MSKITFSEQISQVMENKIHALENLDIMTFLEEDEYFELALCLSYMTLSKELIIEKEMNNRHRMNRLKQMVETKEIDKVFASGFSSRMPKIIYATENNNLWILDNIRDSIMHGVFEVDEQRKLFLINNDQYDREFIAEIPFEWFVSYAKNNILNQKILDNYTVKGIYPNNFKVNKKHFDTKKEIINHIFYTVKITGDKFNVKLIENRLQELFLMYANTTYDENLPAKYIEQINNEKIKYNPIYLASFYEASTKIKMQLEQEFPGININIAINNKKYKIANKADKKLPKHFENYQYMLDEFNNLISKKCKSLINYISNIILFLHDSKNQLITANDFYEIMTIINEMLNGNAKNYETVHEKKLHFNNNMQIMRSICINVYGLSTLVINHENLYNPHFLNIYPQYFGIKAGIQKNYLDYAKKAKDIYMKILDTKILINEKTIQLNSCTNEFVKNKLNTLINTLSNQLTILESDFGNLQFDAYIKYQLMDQEKIEKIDSALADMHNHLNRAKNGKDKKKIKKVISKLIDIKIKETSLYTYGYCNNMQEVLMIIRNSFSHLGRIYIGKEKGLNTIIILNDYNQQHEHSGEVICNYQNLINILNNPYQQFPKQNNNMPIK